MIATPSNCGNTLRAVRYYHTVVRHVSEPQGNLVKILIKIEINISMGIVKTRTDWAIRSQVLNNGINIFNYKRS